MMQQYHVIFHSTQGLILEATVTKFLTIHFIMIYENIFSLHALLISGITLPIPL